MSKNCSICNSQINFFSEYKLNKESKYKICFECYQHLATSLKGDQKSIDTLKSRFKSDIAIEIVEYISSIEKNTSSCNKNNNSQNTDNFMNLMSNNLKPENAQKSHRSNKTIVYIDKLTNQKATRLQRIKIISNICFIALLFIVPLTSFYLLLVINEPIISLTFAVAGIFLILLFGLLRSFLDTIIDER